MTKRRGFTILEVLISALLVGLGMFAIMETFNRGYFGLGDVEDFSLAVSLTQERVEQIKGTAFASVATAARADVAGYTDFEQAVTVTATSANLKRVVVTTYWQVPNGEKNTTLTTYVVNN
jgi:Tfp pilus assembly protein PilV